MSMFALVATLNSTVAGCLEFEGQYNNEYNRIWGHYKTLGLVLVDNGVKVYEDRVEDFTGEAIDCGGRAINPLSVLWNDGREN